MRVLLYENRKIDPFGWDISTKEKEGAGFLALFNYLDKTWRCYSEIERYEEELEKVLSDLNELGNVIEDSESGGVVAKACEEKIKSLKEQQDIWEDMKEQHVLLQSARKGSALSANYLLSNRKNHEYENWQIIRIHDPLEKKK